MDALYPASSMPDRDWWAALWPDPEKMLRGLGIREGMTALDLCCGDGYFTAPLARITAGRTYALDLDPELVAKARVEVARQHASLLGWFTADAGEVARLLPDPVDYVLIANTFHGVPDKAGLVRAVWDALRPGGTFCVVNWRTLPRETTLVRGHPRGPDTDKRMAAKAVATILAAEGFRTEGVSDVGPYHYAMGATRP